jgi:predicted DNA-binding transcriptional regulator AlpA
VSSAARRRGEFALGRISISLVEVDAASKELSSPEEIATALGELERVKALLTSRLTAPTPTAPEKDQLLTAHEAAKRLALSPDTLYRKARNLPFTVKLPGRQTRFSSLGIDRFLRSRQGR